MATLELVCLKGFPVPVILFPMKNINTMISKKSLTAISKKHKTFCKMKNEESLAKLLKKPLYKLRLIGMHPGYHVFSVNKKNSDKKRWIEDPEPPLKAIQQQLNDYLQAVYTVYRSPAAYGFMMSFPRDNEPRNILTNAEKHLGNPWLVNMDAKDFFHSVREKRVFKMFTKAPFKFEYGLAHLLTQLTTHMGRLPMGAPTSPVISNFACRKLDKELLQLSDWAGWTYTRFADDMTFSSKKRISKTDVLQIKKIIQKQNFTLNPDKVQFFELEDRKLVTGLVLKEKKVGVPEKFYKKLLHDILKLKHVMEVQVQLGKARSSWAEKFQKSVAGRINFVLFITGEATTKAQELLAKYDDAVNPRHDLEPVSWMDFPYF